MAIHVKINSTIFSFLNRGQKDFLKFSMLGLFRSDKVNDIFRIPFPVFTFQTHNVNFLRIFMNYKAYVRVIINE